MRIAPFAAIAFGVGVLVLVGILGGANLTEERKSLAAWLVLGISTSALSAVATAIVQMWLGTASGPTPIPVESIQWALGVLPLLVLTGMAGPAAGVAAVRVQWRVQQFKGGVKAWHVGVLVVLLSSLGPAVLVVALWVWWRSGPGLGSRGATKQGDEADGGVLAADQGTRLD